MFPPDLDSCSVQAHLFNAILQKDAAQLRSNMESVNSMRSARQEFTALPVVLLSSMQATSSFQGSSYSISSIRDKLEGGGSHTATFMSAGSAGSSASLLAGIDGSVCFLGFRGCACLRETKTSKTLIKTVLYTFVGRPKTMNRRLANTQYAFAKHAMLSWRSSQECCKMQMSRRHCNIKLYFLTSISDCIGCC